jgi:dolichol-phosphate mannosyltransferase
MFIVIPAYNEGRNVAPLLGQIEQLSAVFPLSVTLVNDGSADDTLVEASKFLGKLDLNIINHPVNQGVPQTFYDGLAAAASRSKADDCIVLIEGDGTSDLALLPEISKQIQAGADIVIASRYIRGGAYVNFPKHRTWGSHVVNQVLRVLLRLRGVTDYTIFYRAYRAGIVMQALSDYDNRLLTGRSFAANLELLLKLQRYVRKHGEVPLRYDYNLKKSRSSMKIGATLMEYQPILLKWFLGRI